jgi:hypothetical protein
MAHLFGIRVLTGVGCELIFSKSSCVVKYNGNIILMGSKDCTTDLWTLPLGTPRTITHHSNKAMIILAAPDCANTHVHSPTNNAFFMHTVQNKANSIHFAYQSLCSPKISMLLKAIC